MNKYHAYDYFDSYVYPLCYYLGSDNMTDQNIILYTQTGCSACNRTKEYLDNKGIEFEDRNVNEDKQALKELTEKYDSKSTPTIVVGDEVIVGFDKNKLDKIIS